MNVHVKTARRSIGAAIAISMLASCAMPVLQVGPPAAANQTLTFGDGRSYSPSVVVPVPGNTCDAHWYIEGFKGAYPRAWNTGVMEYPALRGKTIHEAQISTDEADARLIGPKFSATTPFNQSVCQSGSWSAGKNAGQAAAEQAIQSAVPTVR